jgi:hypothetical protein
MDADKFRANSDSRSAAVFMTHYLLRQKPYRVMWGGDYVVLNDSLEQFDRDEELLGLSTYLSYESFKWNISDLQEKPYLDKVKFIEENCSHWERLNVLKDAIAYFSHGMTASVDYSGFLINHDKQVAVNLKNYYNSSKFFDNHGNLIAVDLIPVLTETGGGLHMAMLEGISAETTENLFTQWCGDLMQISDNVPAGYEIITCCFAEIWSRAEYCYTIFGTDSEDFVIDRDKERYKVVGLALASNNHRVLRYVKVKKFDNGLLLQAEPVTVSES